MSPVPTIPSERARCDRPFNQYAARTAASAVLAAYWLNGRSHRARSLGIVGTGLIARYVYEFLIDTGWTIEEVWLHDRLPQESEKFRTTACRADRHRTV